jgi:hypothetical protein
VVSVARVFTILALAVLLAGCGSSGSDSTGSAGTAEGHPPSTCRGKGFRVELHKVNCEVVNAMIVMLNGRALHQTLTVAWEHGQRARWICRSATHSLVDRLHCQQGAHSFTIEPVP